MSLHIHNTTRRTLAGHRLRQAISGVFAGEGCEWESISAIYCGNRMIRRINREFLQHDYVTDTITFCYHEGAAVDGEFYVSLDVIEENAHRFGVSFDDELLRVTIHSALHLVGYADGTPEERGVMREKEDYYLKLMGVARV